MKVPIISRRKLLKGIGATASVVAGADKIVQRVQAQSLTTQPLAVSPELVVAANKEGRLAFYTAMDLVVAENFAKAFQASIPGSASGSSAPAPSAYSSVSGRRWRAASMRWMSSTARMAPISLRGSATAGLPPTCRRKWRSTILPQYYDPDGRWVTTRVWLSSLGYNINLVKPQDAPKSFADLLDPKWTGKLVKAHPAYSGTIMTATFAIVREFGWSYLEKLAKQRVMQVQSSTDPPKKLALGERAVMADGNDYNLIQLKEAGQPVEVVYPAEGTPVITGPSAVFESAPNPNAARLFQSWLHSLPAQQILIDFARQHSVHPLVKEKPGARKLNEVKLWKDDPAGVEKASEEIKARYAQLFKV